MVQLRRYQIRQGRDAVKALIKDNPELQEELEERIKQHIKEQQNA